MSGKAAIGQSCSCTDVDRSLPWDRRIETRLQYGYWKPLMTDITQLGSTILGLLLAIMTFLFIFRIVLTWYPQLDLNRWPFNLFAWPTEPFLIPLRKIIPPLGGVDITPIVWVGIFSLLRELLLGQQGLLTMMAH